MYLYVNRNNTWTKMTCFLYYKLCLFTVAILAQSSIRHGFFSNFWRAFPQKKAAAGNVWERYRHAGNVWERYRHANIYLPSQENPGWLCADTWSQRTEDNAFEQKRKIAMKTANISVSKYNPGREHFCYQMMIRRWSLWDFMVNRMSWWFIQDRKAMLC